VIFQAADKAEEAKENLNREKIGAAQRFVILHGQDDDFFLSTLNLE